MIIGTFRNIDDSYVGELVGFGFGRMPVVLIPMADKGTYDVVYPETGDDVSISLGKAIHKKGKKGGYLLFQIDSPTLPQPIEAVMGLVASRQGLYTLEWQRKEEDVTPSKDKKKKRCCVSRREDCS